MVSTQGRLFQTPLPWYPESDAGELGLNGNTLALASASVCHESWVPSAIGFQMTLYIYMDIHS